jgi:hypothetical protein
MVWTEIDVDRPLNEKEIQVAVGKTFGIAAERVLVVADFGTDVAAIDPAISLVVEHHTQPGDFPERMTFVMWDGQIRELTGAEETSEASYAAISALSSHLNASVIAPDSEIDPYTAVLFTPSGDAYRIELDSTILDDLGGVSISNHYPKVHAPELSHLPQRHLMSS